VEGLCYLYFRPNVEARAAIMQPEKIGYKRDCVPAHNPILLRFRCMGRDDPDNRAAPIPSLNTQDASCYIGGKAQFEFRARCSILCCQSKAPLDQTSRESLFQPFTALFVL